MIELSELKIGESARIVAIGGEVPFRRRLNELGLTVSGKVSCYAMAVGGRTAVYLTEGGLIALRKRDAKLVWCEMEEGAGQEGGANE